MKKQKKLLAIIMSVVMLFGTVSMTASAAYNAYLDDAIIDQYNSIDKVELTALFSSFVIISWEWKKAAKEQILWALQA